MVQHVVEGRAVALRVPVVHAELVGRDPALPRHLVHGEPLVERDVLVEVIDACGDHQPVARRLRLELLEARRKLQTARRQNRVVAHEPDPGLTVSAPAIELPAGEGLVRPARSARRVGHGEVLLLVDGLEAHAVLVRDGRVELERERLERPVLVELDALTGRPRRAACGGSQLPRIVEEREAALRRLRRHPEAAVPTIAEPHGAADGDVLERLLARERERRDPRAAHEVELAVDVLEVLPVAVEDRERVVGDLVRQHAVQHRADLLVRRNRERTHGDRPLHEVEVLVRRPVLERERRVELPDLEHRQVAPRRDPDVVVRGRDPGLGGGVRTGGSAEREITGDVVEERRAHPARELDARATNQEARHRHLVRLALVEVAVHLEAAVRHEHEGVVLGPEVRGLAGPARERIGRGHSLERGNLRRGRSRLDRGALRSDHRSGRGCRGRGGRRGHDGGGLTRGSSRRGGCRSSRFGSGRGEGGVGLRRCSRFGARGGGGCRSHTGGRGGLGGSSSGGRVDLGAAAGVAPPSERRQARARRASRRAPARPAWPPPHPGRTRGWAHKRKPRRARRRRNEAWVSRHFVLHVGAHLGGRL